MQPRITLPITLLAAAAVYVTVIGLSDPQAPTPLTRAVATPTVVTPTPIEPRATPDPRAVEATYRLSYRFETTFGDSPGAAGRVEGIWRTRTTADGRQAIWLEDPRIEGHEMLPDPADLSARVELAGLPGRPIEGMGFPAEMPAEARRLYTALATAFAYTDLPGETYRVAEQDITGSYTADYTAFENIRVRTVAAYSALRRGPRLVDPGQMELTPAGQSRFVLDRAGLVEARIDTTTTIALGEGMPDMVTAIEARLERITIDDAPLTAGTTTIEPLQDHVDHARLAAEASERALDGVDLPQLLRESARVAGLDPEDPDTRKWRSVTLRALSAQVRRDPAAARALAERIRQNPGSISENSLLLGALGSADTVAAVDALTGLLDADLSPGSRRALMGQLAVTQAASPAALEPLTAAADAGEPLALTTLGSQAGKQLGTEAGDAAVDHILQTLAGATDRAGTLDALRALGNTGAEQALPAVADLIDSADDALSTAAIFALRFMPPGDADALLEQALTDGGRRAIAAARAAVYRDADHWIPFLLQTREGDGLDDRRLASVIAHSLRLLN